jgi:hypothetical protein
LSEAGATAHEIAAVTGHISLEEIERYTRAARKKKLADSAIAKLKSRALSVPLSESGTFRMKNSTISAADFAGGAP